ncbi:MAG: ATP-binding protein [Spirochaetales bacterium]|uniref:histidine kinase n=1 Tax=Candidatus Thalassospirochaeta sargassi TaxID=3119039 RepID=A0AAJ1IJV7_9SPIO|nr:ATP-binding protein [Spirochaetales bacterium]
MAKSEGIKVIRKSIFLALVIYGIFGVLDYYALPINFKNAWIIRYFLLIPASLIALGLTYIPMAEKIAGALSHFLLISGVAGILLILIISEPEEPAFYFYSAGLSLMILACDFIFRLNILSTALFFILTELSYILTAIFEQKILDEAIYSNGHSWLAGNVFFITFTGIISLMGTMRIHEEIKTSEDARIQAEKANMIKTAFLTNISHEIRTPLNGIIGYSRLISIQAGDKCDQSYLKIIRECGDQLTETVDSIIDIAGIETGHVECDIELLSIRPFIRDVSRVFSIRASSKNITLKLIFSGISENTNINTDSHKLRAMLNSLIGNALKFTETGEVALICELKENRLEINVRDTGIGIASEYMQEIFSPFFQINSGYERPYRGNGLGLSICRSYAELLGGSIEVKSIEGQGSTFTLNLPV